MQRMKTLINIIFIQPSDPHFTKFNVFIGMCFKEDRPITKAKVKGQPLVISQNERDAFLNSFISQTTRDLVDRY